jgi:hypothetical protein
MLDSFIQNQASVIDKDKRQKPARHSLLFLAAAPASFAIL